jgi:hypothetical protein
MIGDNYRMLRGTNHFVEKLIKTQKQLRDKVGIKRKTRMYSLSRTTDLVLT